MNNVTCSASSPVPEVEAEASSFLPPFLGTLRVTTILNDLTVNWQGFFLQNTRKNRWLFSMKLIATVTKLKCPARIGPKSSSEIDGDFRICKIFCLFFVNSVIMGLACNNSNLPIFNFQRNLFYFCQKSWPRICN